MQSRLSRPTLFHSLLLAIAALVPIAPTGAQKVYFNASLDGSQQNPPVTTSATGWATIQFDTTTNRVEIVAHSTGVAGTAAHLHIAARGTNGPVIVPLAGGPTWTGGAVLSATNAAALTSGGTYINIHSAANPSGEIRGQVELSRAARFVAALDGLQEVPANTSTATGSAELVLYEPDNVLTYTVATSGLSNVTAAHIHTGNSGQNGPVLHPLTGTAGDYCGYTVLTSAQVTTLKAGGLYVNVHTSSFPAGEIRGQIGAFDGDFFARLEGAQQVPPVSTTADGTACVRLNPDNTLTYITTTTGLTATAAHFHRAAKGTNGPVVIGFTGGPTTWSGTTRALTATEIADLRAGLWYVNVHTAANPGGEIRGQLGPAALPTVYGGGCPANGATAQITATGFACIGRSYSVEVRGARPNSNCELILGVDRGQFGPATLPLNLTFLGMTNCFLLTDLQVRGLAALTDARGCAAVQLPLPFLPSLRGVEFFAQWLVLAPGANPAGGVVSNGLQSIVH
ncbi:MAG: CHRD domain-containing protein [Planctomycetes bacterium]|nr:CHRD domain-containing protein [Planctomycetota bacterium]MCB9871698.1 CHRD domain-containing protein [Planctomycetota bacterium]